MKAIRILLVEDSPVFADVVREVLGDEFDMELVGLAHDGAEAIAMCATLKPDIVLMDLQLPNIDGLEATQRIMADSPTPILVVTADPFRDGVDLSFRALSAGALDLVAKPDAFPWPNDHRRDFLRKIRLLAQVPVVRHMRGVNSTPSKRPKPPRRTTSELAAIAVVASTGGPRALARMLSGVPTDASLPPILVVQHIIRGFSSHLVSWLDRVTPLRVVEASHGESVVDNTVYVAPADAHLELRPDGRLSLTPGAPVDGHCPSGDMLLESVARAAGPRSVGMILSGMGSDGAAGCAAVRHAGGATLAQDRATCVVYGMPQSAIDLELIDDVVAVDDMLWVALEKLRSSPGRT